MDTNHLLQQPDQTYPGQPAPDTTISVCTDPETGMRTLTVRDANQQFHSPDSQQPAVVVYNPETGVVVSEAYYRHGEPDSSGGAPQRIERDPQTGRDTQRVWLSQGVETIRLYSSDGATTTLRNYPADRDLPNILRVNPDGLSIEEWVTEEGVPVSRPGGQPNYVETYTELPADGVPRVVAVSVAWFDQDSELHREGGQPALIVYDRDTGEVEDTVYAWHGKTYVPENPGVVANRPLLEPAF